jgi:hypothetical protein
MEDELFKYANAGIADDQHEERADKRDPQVFQER